MKPARRIVIIVVVLAVVFGAVLTSRWIQAKNDAILQGSGTVEARYIRVGSKVGGRVDKVLVREGDKVEAGQVLVTFDDKELQASLEQSKAAYDKAHTGSRKEDIAAARAATAEAKAEYEQRMNGYRREDIAGAQSDLDRAKADEVGRTPISTVTRRCPRKTWFRGSSVTRQRPPGKWPRLCRKTRRRNSINCARAIVRRKSPLQKRVTSRPWQHNRRWNAATAWKTSN